MHARTIAAMICGALACDGCRHSSPAAPSTSPGGATTAWSDEFDGLAQSLPDPGKWTYDLGNNNGWGNRELETYTSSVENVHLDGLGHLVIRVASTPAGFTSARIKTQGRFAAQYGHLEARIQLPAGQGIWPAFWLLGNGFDGTNWPQIGEVDICENRGSEPSVNHGSLHGPSYSGGNAITATYVLPSGEKFATGFHLFAIDWAPQSIAFLVDGMTYKTVTPASLPSGASWVFDAPFFLILNVAVGGNFPGPPDATTMFPQEMLVDYIRYTPLTKSGAPR